MKVSRLIIENLRGIKNTALYFPDHAVLIGDNNVGKTTVLEALDLVLGPDRLNRRPVIEEHDFYQGRYLILPTKSEETEAAPAATPTAALAAGAKATAIAAAATEATAAEATPPAPANDDEEEDETASPKITIEATVIKLSDEQRAKFKNHIEWWDNKTNKFYDVPNPEGVDAAGIVEALRVTFVGEYDADTDDFEGNTYFTRSMEDGTKPELFTKKDKQLCGFLYLRSLRTGSRALTPARLG